MQAGDNPKGFLALRSRVTRWLAQAGLAMSLVLLGLGSITHVAYGQAQPPFDIKETFSFAACHAVASDGTLPDASQRIFMEAGSGFYVLDGSALQPVKPTNPLITDYKVRSRGLVRDVKWTTDKVWVVAGIAGLKRYRRDTFAEDLTFKLGESEPAAWSLDVVRVGNSDFVVVGSNENEVGGRLYLVEVSASGIPVVHDEIDMYAPVYSVAASTDLLAGHITVLAGTACWSENGCSSLRRYEISPSTGAPVFGSPVAVWPPSPPCNTKAFIRDILIDETPNGVNVAYVAAYTAGTHAFRLDSGGLQEINGQGWPILGPNGQTSGVYRHMGLALYDPGNVLVVALGPPFADERQWWGQMNVPKSCDDLASPASSEGIALFDLDTNPVNYADGVIPKGSLGRAPVSVAVRPRSNGTFLIDSAVTTLGLRVVRAAPNASAWTLSVVGEWSQLNQPPNEQAPGGSFDDVLVTNGRAYVGTEAGLLTFNNLTAPTALKEFSDFTTPGAILISHVSENIPQPVEVLYSFNTEDVVFHDLSDPDHPVSKAGFYDRPSPVRGFGCMAIEGPDDTRWLYLANKNDNLSYLEYVPCDPNLSSCQPTMWNGSIRVVRVENQTDGIVTDPVNQSTELIGYYAPSVCCGQGNEHFTALDVYAVPHPSDPNSHVLWVNFSRKAELEEPKEGLMVLTSTWNPPPVDTVDFNFVEKIYFDGTVPDDQDGECGRLTYDAARHKLYAVYGADGVAMYDVSNPLQPQLEGTHSWLWLLENPMTSLSMRQGPGNYVYVALMNYGVGIIDATNAQTFGEGLAFGPYETAGSCDALFEAPADPGFPARSAVYMADGAGGVHRVQFNVFGP